MLTGSSDLDEIQTISRRLYERGRDILGFTSQDTKKRNRAGISNRHVMGFSRRR